MKTMTAMKNIHRLISICSLLAAVHAPAALAMGEKSLMDNPTPPGSTSAPKPEAATDAEKTSSIVVEVLYRDQQCGMQQALVRWIESQQAYQSTWEELRRTYAGGQAGRFPPVDWEQYGALLVAMGPKNTGGYAVDLASDDARINQGVLTILVNWREPQKGMMVTQALTSPCMLLKVPRTQFERIEIKDSSGAVRLSGATQKRP